MNNLEQHISNFIGKETDHHYYVACSGGVDSIVLLNLLSNLRLNVSALHVNYKLRGVDSDLDQASVEEFCKQKNIPCHIRQIDLQEYLNKHGGNLQEEARKVRYTFFETFKKNSNCKIVLGHHADDQIETFFLNLGRNSGVMGLACMLPKHHNYIRPLLAISKDDIVAYAKNNSIVWREDVSNQSNKYSRNKLRNVILPELKSRIPTLNESVLMMTTIFQAKQLELSNRIKPLIDRINTTQILTSHDFDLLDEFDKVELLRQLEISPVIITEIEKLRKAIKGKKVVLKNSAVDEIINEGTHFFFKKVNPLVSLPILQIERVNSIPDKFSKDILFLDSAKINGELNIRRWQIGDRMKPIGMKGSKLISDILNDAKIPNHLRLDQFVVHDDEKIVWCVGLCIGREAVGGKGTKILKVVLSLPS